MISSSDTSGDWRDTVANLLDVVRTRTGMDVAWMSRFDGPDQVFEVVAHDGDLSELEAGDRGRLVESYCQRVLLGDIPALISDTAVVEGTSRLPITAAMGIGSYLGAPVLDGFGSPIGMVCAVGRSRRDLSEEDHRVVALVADLVSAVAGSSFALAAESDEVADRIRREIDERLYRIVFQPIVDVATGAIRGAEALSRFSCAPLRPDQWFAEAHRHGMGVELELAVLTAAIDQVGDLPDDAYLALNVSPAAAVDDRLSSVLRGCALDRVVLEITEHAEIDDYAELRQRLQRLREDGVRLAADDVGAGFASFAHVLELRPDLLKIDRSIMRGIDGDPARRSLVEAIVGLASRIDATVVAEGVETRAELGVVAALDVTAVQGYVIARPQELPLREVSMPEPLPVPVAGKPEDLSPLVVNPFALALRHSPIGKCLVGLDGSFIQVNAALVKMLGYTATMLTELTFQDITHPDDLACDLGLLQECLGGERESYRIDKRYLCADGSVIWGDLSVVLVRDGGGQPLYFISQIVDVTDRREREAQNSLDALTGALQRPQAVQSIQDAMSEGRDVALVLFRVTGLGEINDRHGIVAGDQSLVALAELVRTHARADDLITRWNGSTVALVVFDVDRVELAGTVQRMLEALYLRGELAAAISVRSAHTGDHGDVDALIGSLAPDRRAAPDESATQSSTG